MLARLKRRVHFQVGPRGSDGEEPAPDTYPAAGSSVSNTTLTLFVMCK